MNPLNLSLLNSTSPYNIVKAEEGTYVFQARNQVLYAVSFCEDMSIADCVTYQVSINRLSSDPIGFDSDVRETIVIIIKEFFNQNDNILLYICDTTDGREANRNRLFIQWFRNADTHQQYTLKTAHTTVEGIGFYTAIIVRNTNPKLQQILAEFDMTAANLTAK